MFITSGNACREAALSPCTYMARVTSSRFKRRSWQASCSPLLSRVMGSTWKQAQRLYMAVKSLVVAEREGDGGSRHHLREVPFPLATHGFRHPGGLPQLLFPICEATLILPLDAAQEAPGLKIGVVIGIHDIPASLAHEIRQLGHKALLVRA
jgi:hypothetical protein